MNPYDVVLVVLLVPYVLTCRVLWHLGSYLRRKD